MRRSCSVLRGRRARSGLPVLFTDLTNQTSNDICRRLDCYPVEDRLEIRFLETIAKPGKRPVIHTRTL